MQFSLKQLIAFLTICGVLLSIVLKVNQRSDALDGAYDGSWVSTSEGYTKSWSVHFSSQNRPFAIITYRSTLHISEDYGWTPKWLSMEWRKAIDGRELQIDGVELRPSNAFVYFVFATDNESPVIRKIPVDEYLKGYKGNMIPPHVQEFWNAFAKEQNKEPDRGSIDKTKVDDQRG